MKYFIVLMLLTNFVGAMLQPLTKQELRIVNYAIRKMSCLQGQCACPRHYYGCRHFGERLDLLRAQAMLEPDTDFAGNKIQND